MECVTTKQEEPVRPVDERVKLFSVWEDSAVGERASSRCFHCVNPGGNVAFVVLGLSKQVCVNHSSPKLSSSASQGAAPGGLAFRGVNNLGWKK